MISSWNARIYKKVREVLHPDPNWEIRSMQIHEDKRSIEIYLAVSKTAEHKCPACRERLGRDYQTKLRTFRYLAIAGMQTHITAEQPWINCSKHGPQPIPLPWEQELSEYLALSKTI